MSAPRAAAVVSMATCRETAPLFDLVVVGAGPAGLATAIGAALRGYRVALLCPQTGPQNKACGEGLLPAGVAALARLGVVLPQDAAVRLTGVDYVYGRHRVHAPFSPLAPALGVARTRLSEALRARAQTLPIAWWSGRVVALRPQATEVQLATTAGALRGRFVVGADGLHSRVRALGGLAGAPARCARYGLRRHVRLGWPSRHIEVHVGDGVEAYVTPVGPEEINLAFLTERPALGWQAHLAAFGALAARVADAPTSRTMGAGPFEQRVHAISRERLALVGDAAGYLDAVTGEGVSLALLGAEAWVAAMATPRPARVYARGMAPARRHYLWHAAVLRAALRRRWLVRVAMAVLARWPAMLRWWVQAAVALPRPRIKPRGFLSRA